MPVKGKRGYFKKKKRKTFLLMLLMIAIGLLMIFVGFEATHTKKNLLTVFGILFVLPAAKYFTILVTMLPYKEMPGERYDAFHALLSGNALEYADLVFTSPETVMHLDYLAAAGTELAAFSSGDSSRDSKIINYFTDSLGKRGISAHMHIFHDADAMKKRMASLRTEESVPEEITEFIQMIIV